MTKNFFLTLVSAAVAVFFTACSSGLKPLASDYIKAEPQPLELIAGKVPVTINATFPAKWFNKKATLTVLPVLRYEGGEALGTPYVFQGEKVSGNGQTIPQKTGANVVLKSSFDYVPAMQSSQLYLTFTAKVGSKSIALPDVQIGDGVLSTADLLDATTENPAIAPDKFQRVIKEAYDANILFLIQQAELRSSELKKAELSNWKGLVEKADQAPNQDVKVEISAYASPDGGYDLNDKLAGKREANTKKYLTKELSKTNTPISARYTAQDWDGFKDLVEKSNIQDKELILRVLSMYKDSERREQEIKNISSVFKVLADEILPQLRRSRLTANVEIIGKSDEEISALATSNPGSLSLEELLYAASLAKSLDQKGNIYQNVIKFFPNDARGYNDLGVVEFIKGNISNAETNFTKALRISGNLPEANFNLGFVALTKGDKAKAEEYFGKASGVSQLNSASGLLALLNGNYNQAAQSFGSTVSNNAALAQILSKDYNKAQNTLNAIANPDATTAYLKAIVGARTNNLDTVVSNLKTAISLKPALASKALNDVEFAKFITNRAFLEIVKYLLVFINFRKACMIFSARLFYIRIKIF
jgi:Flp pilus assembly protein TadD